MVMDIIISHRIKGRVLDFGAGEARWRYSERSHLASTGIKWRTLMRSRIFRCSHLQRSYREWHVVDAITFDLQFFFARARPMVSTSCWSSLCGCGGPLSVWERIHSFKLVTERSYF